MVCGNRFGDTRALGHARAVPGLVPGSAFPLVGCGPCRRGKRVNQERLGCAALLLFACLECRAGLAPAGNDGYIGKPGSWMGAGTRWSSLRVDEAGGEP
jgi:hypothetical protein